MTIDPPPWLRPMRQAVRSALLHLHSSLARLARRVRETVVEAVAQAAAEVVRQTTGQWLPPTEEFLDRAPRHPHGPQQFWDEPYPDESAFAPDRPAYSDWEDDEPAVEPEPTPPAPSRLPAALANGCRVAAWLLDRGSPRGILRALGAAVLTTVAALSGGPAVAAGVGLVGSLATWLSLHI
ncbi:MAG: hypothetical protein JNM56_02695 [Planctomycetia bacterium]|nr:hypothetical protein [Planctomycetia bacterium]